MDGDAEASQKKKKKKVTSWQRKKAAKLGVSVDEVVKARKLSGRELKAKKFGESKAAEVALREACAAAKAAANEARERFRLGRPALPGDADLAWQYSQAKTALNASLEASRRALAASAQAGGAAGPTKAAVTGAAAADGLANDKKRRLTEGKDGAVPTPAETAPELSNGKIKKQKRAEEAAAAAAEMASRGDGELWTCETCDVTILVRPDGRAREQHLAGKAHAKAHAKLGTGADSARSGSPERMYVCKLCACTLAQAAGATHESGEKHRERLHRLNTFLEKHSAGDGGTEERLKKGDWICYSASHGAPQLVYASRNTCCRPKCSTTKREGITQEEAGAMAAADAPPAPMQQRPREGKGKDGRAAPRGAGEAAGKRPRKREASGFLD